MNETNAKEVMEPTTFEVKPPREAGKQAIFAPLWNDTKDVWLEMYMWRRNAPIMG